MGIHGLWQVLEPTGRPVNINSLRGKTLSIDVSIWLHQLVKGFRDKDGNPLPNAHLLGVFHRICKLLNYGIKPIFVFDGGVPVLKRQTLAARRQRKLESLDKAEISRQKILSAFLQQQLQRQVKQALPPSYRIQSKIAALASNRKGSQSVSPKKRKLTSDIISSTNEQDAVDEDLETFRAALAAKLGDEVDQVSRTRTSSASDSEDENVAAQDYHYGVDYSDNFSMIQNPEFDTLPLETQHEILFEMQESRKMNSWGKFDKMPKDLPSFSSYQMDRLVKRRNLQKKIQSVQQEMGQRHIHVQNLDDLLKMEYNFDTKDTQISGSQEDGYFLVKFESQKETKDDKDDTKEPKPGSSKYAKRTEPKVITIEDFKDSSSEDDLMPTEVIKHGGFGKNETSSTQRDNRSRVSEDEDEDLKVAIQLSLEESRKSSSVPRITADNRGNDSFARRKESKGNESVDKKEEVFMSIKEEIISSKTSISKTDSEDQAKTDYESRKDFPLMSMDSNQISHCAKFFDTVGVHHIPFATKSASDDMIIQEKSAIAEVSSSESDDDFEEVETGKSYSVTSASDNKLTTVNPTVATIDLHSIRKEAIENDIFADIFASQNMLESVEKVADSTSDALAEARSKTPIESDKTYNNGEVLKPDSVSTVEATQPDNDVQWDSSDSDIEHDLIEMVVESASNHRPTAILPSNLKNTPNSLTPNVNIRSSGTTNSSDAVLVEENKPGPSSKIITAEYMQAQEKLNFELAKLQSEKGFQERVATSISDQMQIETQELISLFGIPYVISPTEAESQCAFLDRACLTEGTITDDSDVWLFGGQRVYKNFFSQGQKHTELYQAADIQRVLNLSREKLIVLAMLIGSDYSEGIQGVGPVLALEIFSEFSNVNVESFEILVMFREWWEEIQSKKPNVFSGSKVKEKLRKLKLRPGFPSKVVYEAFTNPTIDQSTEAFKWGNPDLDAIRSYTKSKFGWEQSKCDSMLMPVLKNRCEVGRQLSLDSFISFGKMPSLDDRLKRKKGSKRMQNAMKKLKRDGGANSNELNLSSESDSDIESTSKAAKRVEKLEINRGNKLSKPKKVKNSTAIEVPVIATELSSRSRPGTTNIFELTPELIPQRVQEESDKLKNKQKAIEIFKKGKAKKK